MMPWRTLRAGLLVLAAALGYGAMVAWYPSLGSLIVGLSLAAGGAWWAAR